MDFYLSGRYARREEINEFAAKLLERWHKVCSTWHECAHPDTLERTAPDTDRRAWAEQDLKELRESNAIICFTESLGSMIATLTDGEPARDLESCARGGRHVELGIALAYNLPVTVIGPRENVFHCLPGVVQHETQEGFFAALERFHADSRGAEPCQNN